MILNKAVGKASLVFEWGPEGSERVSLAGEECCQQRTSAKGRYNVPSRCENQPRRQVNGTKGGRRRLITEKVQEVTWARWSGPQRLFWWPLNLRWTPELPVIYSLQRRGLKLREVMWLSQNSTENRWPLHFTGPQLPLSQHNPFMHMCVYTHTPYTHTTSFNPQHAKVFPAQYLHTYCSFWLECFSPYSWANQCIFWALVQI